jgi:hypothetical protein
MTHLAAQYFLNHRLDPAEVRWQTRALAEAGYDAVYAHARQGLLTPFMSEAWWQALDVMIDVCRDTGMQFWIWDEDYYPSGTAGERIVWENPGLLARSLELIAVEVSGDGPFEADFAPGHCLGVYAIPHTADGAYGAPVDISAHAGTRRQRWTARQRLHRAYSPDVNAAGPPHWRCSMVDNQVAVVWEPPAPGCYTLLAAIVKTHVGRHPDILRPESIRAFLDICYEPYLERYGEHFGNLLGGAFTDEPSPGGMLYPWTATFPEAFREDHGYDLLPNLPHLGIDLDASSPAVRLHVRQTQHRLQQAAYTSQIGAWCRKHGIVSTGHLTRTEWLSYVAAAWPNELRFYKDMDIPCADPLGAASAWPDAAAYHTGLKVAASAAHLFGKKQAGSDCLAVMGDETSLRDLKFVLDYQMAMGITFFTVHGLSYSLDGPRKDEVPPSVFYQHPQWRHMKALLDHTRYTAEALCRGRHACGIAVLYPSTSLACQLRPGVDWRHLPDDTRMHQLAETLLSHQKDFDFIDEITLAECTTTDGKLGTPEPYTVILIPYVKYIGEAAAAALTRLAAAGLRVVAIGTLPATVPSALRPCTEGWQPPEIDYVPVLDDAFIESLPGPVLEGTGRNDVFINRRTQDNAATTLLFNRAESEFYGTYEGSPVYVPPRGAVLVTDGAAAPHPLEGCDPVSELRTGWYVAFEPNQAPLAFWHAQAAPAGSAPNLAAPGFNLLEREADPLPPADTPAMYHCRIMVCGSIADLRLVMEDSTAGGTWTVRVNGAEAGPFERAVISDCRNIQARIGHLLKGGSTPTLNLVTVETAGPGRGLFEMPYLYGSFTCEFRHGHPSLPVLKAEESAPAELTSLLPWNVLGRPAFSGTATYNTDLTIPARGTYRLDLGRVEDVAAVRVNGRDIAVLPWPPYVCALGELDPGKHTLEVDVTNGPANRNRMSALAAGLLGPVTLYRNRE